MVTNPHPPPPISHPPRPHRQKSPLLPPPPSPPLLFGRSALSAAPLARSCVWQCWRWKSERYEHGGDRVTRGHDLPLASGWCGVLCLCVVSRVNVERLEGAEKCAC